MTFFRGQRHRLGHHRARRTRFRDSNGVGTRDQATNDGLAEVQQRSIFRSHAFAPNLNSQDPDFIKIKRLKRLGTTGWTRQLPTLLEVQPR